MKKKKIDFIENLTHRTAQDAGWTVSETITHVFLSYGILLSPPLPGSAEQIPLGGRPKEVGKVYITNFSGSLKTAHTEGRLFDGKFSVIPLYISRVRKSLVPQNTVETSSDLRRKTLLTSKFPSLQ